MMKNSLTMSRARALYEARANRRPIPPFTDVDPDLSVEDGYAIQQELLAMLLADGDRVVGYKAGLTSSAMQDMFGIGSPDYGPVLASTVYADGDTIDPSLFIDPRIEAEIVFRLGSQLVGPDVTISEARLAVADVMAGLEIVDSRIADWRIRLADTIADLASNGAVALAGRSLPAAEVETRSLGMILRRNGDPVATGLGTAALGNPLEVVVWLANILGTHGVALEPGHFVMTGALHRAVPMSFADEFVAEFDALGSVTIQVADAARRIV